MPGFQRSACFLERAIRPMGLVKRDGWRLKRYDIAHDNRVIPMALATEGVERALGVLPHHAEGPHRPGVGFVLCHQGAGALYVVLGWWENQNEMVTRVLVRRNGPGGGWADGADKYSFCVWDLEVMWHERNAFVRHVMNPIGGPEFDAYLADFISRG